MFPWMKHEVSGCSPETAVAMTNPPSSSALREFLDRLTSSTQISKYLELPMICVMGDTSSGKSSLLSNLSGIELPSSHTLTTRCPILLSMSPSSERKATIQVQWKSSLFQCPNFDERIITEEEWGKIPGIILEAQQHILDFTKKEISPDIVSVRVSSPEITTDLTLIDLPGLVRNKANNESETLIADISELIHEYLRNPRCIILAVLPANVDFHNAQILADAKAVDPLTERTLPVITKPDLVDPGAEEEVLKLLMNEKTEFQMGFHMIKARGQAALDRMETIANGLEQERLFFSVKEPWKSIENRSLFGTHNLSQKLGDMQIQLIRQAVPGILHDIRDRQQISSKALQEMGEVHQTVLDRRRYYQDLCQNLLSQLQASLSGKGRGSRPSAASSLHDACSVFRDNIRRGSLATIKAVTEGAIVLVTGPRGVVKGEVVHLDEEFACVDFVDEADSQSEALFDFVGKQSLESIEENDVWSDGSKVFIGRKLNMYDVMKKIPLASIRTDPSWLKERIAENRTDDLACFLNVDIFKNIIEDFMESEWKPHCLSLVKQTRSILLQSVNESVQSALPSDRYPHLRSFLQKQCHYAMENLIQQAEKQVLSHLEVEKHPYTQDDILFQNISESRHRALRRELEEALRLEQEGVFDTQAIKAIMDSVFERNQRKTVEDHMAEEMEIVLESYGQVATRRVIDRTPMIMWEVCRSLAKTVQDSLWAVTDDTLMQYMQETLEFAARYKALSEELEEMNKGIEIFESIA